MNLLSLCEELGLEAQDLDELVHDLCEQEASASFVPAYRTESFDKYLDIAADRAAQINNDGLQNQILFLLGEIGGIETERTIREIAQSKVR